LLNGSTSLATINQKIASVHNTKLDVYDSLGNAHTLEVSWEKIDNNQWRWRAWLPSEPGVTISNNTGIMEFDSDGKITTGSSGVIGLNFASLGADDATITLDFTGESFGKDVMEGVTQYGSTFTTKGYYQDGYGMGVLNDFAAGKDGTITGVYSNGVNLPLYRIALALFSNPTGLTKVGSTAFAASNNSGLAQVVAAGEGGAGTIAGGTLEMANVDLSEEFVRLIVAQRGFQANARVVTTSDQVLEEVINIKR
ncbi:MAG TPA: flagellar hook-basal body complex protein, partial [Aminivibrio sp.]|nr:flagellar hook-basal body complex protein [Aminivibrio sp.]